MKKNNYQKVAKDVIQKEIDENLVELDGSQNKKRLGANSILAVSLACAKASSNLFNIPLYKYIGGIHNSLPTPMMNIMNGGCHSSNNLDFQEFMIIPANFKTFPCFQRISAQLIEKHGRYSCLK